MAKRAGRRTPHRVWYVITLDCGHRRRLTRPTPVHGPWMCPVCNTIREVVNEMVYRNTENGD